MSWRDRQYQQSSQRAPSLPWIQWQNDGSNIDPRQPLGGPFQPNSQAVALARQMGIEEPEKNPVRIPGIPATLYFRSGASEEGVFAPEITVAVLGNRFYWAKKNESPRRGKCPGAGWRGKTQYVVLVEDGDRVIGPTMLTFTGWAGTYFANAFEVFAGAVEKATDGKAPARVFWATFRSSGTEMVGRENKSRITTAVWTGDSETFDPNAVYVGDAVADQIEALFPEVMEWCENLEYQPNGNDGSNGNGKEPAPVSTAPQPQPKNPDAPAGEAQWRLVRKLMAEIGIEGQEAQDRALRKRGFDPANLTMGQASVLIGRLKAAKNGNGGK